MADAGGGLTLTVQAGDVARENTLVVAQVPAERVPMVAGPVGEQREPAKLSVVGEDGVELPAQYDALRGELAFVLTGTAQEGASQQFTVVGGWRATPEWRVEVVQKLDRVIFLVGGQPYATYTVAGARRPYVWPLLGPSGASVVRGQGTGDHPHHTGLNLAYGGHSEGGSANIWSDWDEPPYGPGGRMIHRGFRRVISGPVYGEVTHDITYVNAYGDPIVDEVRTVRAWWGSNEQRYLDFTFEILSARDRGPRPFFLAVRLPNFGITEGIGKITNSAGRPVPAPQGEDRFFHAEWMDASGPTGDPPWAPATAPPEVLVDAPGYVPPRKGPPEGPWNGIALFDHPENNGYPNIHGKYAGSRGTVQMTQGH